MAERWDNLERVSVSGLCTDRTISYWLTACLGSIPVAFEWKTVAARAPALEAASGTGTTESSTMEGNTCDLLSRSKSVSTFPFHFCCKMCTYCVFSLPWALRLCCCSYVCGKTLVSFQFSNRKQIVKRWRLIHLCGLIDRHVMGLLCNLPAFPLIPVSLIMWYWTLWYFSAWNEGIVKIE